MYVVGTGDTGVSGAMFTLAATYYCTIMIGSAAVRVPAEGWWPAGVPKDAEEEANTSLPSVDYDAALKTAQFPLFFSLVMGNAFAGMILISSAKASTLPSFVCVSLSLSLCVCVCVCASL